MSKLIKNSIKGLLIVGLLASVDRMANASHTGSVHHNPVQNPSQSQSMSLKDFESLLGQGRQSGLSASQELAQLSPAARKQLLSQVRRLSKEKDSVIKEEEEKSKTLQLELRKQRRKIQNDRLNTFGPMDEKAKKQLFSNLLDQANIDAQAQSTMQEIEERFMITVNFEGTGSALKVINIAAGETSLWMNLSRRQLAQQD